MSQEHMSHPSEEDLAACALGECSETVKSHLAQCPECAAAVEQARAARSDVAQLAEDDVPADAEERIKRLRRHGRHGGAARPSAWYRSPLVFALGLGAVAMVVFVFFLIQQ